MLLLFFLLGKNSGLVVRRGLECSSGIEGDENARELGLGQVIAALRKS